MSHYYARKAKHLCTEFQHECQIEDIGNWTDTNNNHWSNIAYAVASRPTVGRLVHCLADRQPRHYAPPIDCPRPQTLFLILSLNLKDSTLTCHLDALCESSNTADINRLTRWPAWTWQWYVLVMLGLSDFQNRNTGDFFTIAAMPASLSVVTVAQSKPVFTV